jgi:uncharacterized RDD family membrane protein YckC
VEKVSCPLCQKQRPSKKFKPLYLTPVCHKCYYAFANRRQIAFLIDVILWRIAMFAFFFLIGIAIGAISAPQSFAAWEIGLNLLAWAMVLVFILKDGFSGCSPGKAICGVCVVDSVTYQEVGFGRSFKRNLPIAIPLVPLVIAFTLAKGQRLGDRWADTKVVWSKYRFHPVFNLNTYCSQCQYDLHGNTTGACPECGKQIDDATMACLEKEQGKNRPAST